MTYKQYINRPVVLWGAALVLLLTLGYSNAFAQAKQLLSWQENLAYLKTVSEEELAQNRTAIQHFHL